MSEFVCLIGLLLGAYGAGKIVNDRLRWTPTRSIADVLFAIAMGLTLLQGLMFFLGVLGVLYATVLHGVAAAWAGLALWTLTKWGPWLGQHVRRLPTSLAWYQLVAVAVAGFGLLANAVRALAPPHGATDPLAYQLALPKLYLLSNTLGFEESVNGALYPAAINMLYMLGLAVSSDSMPQLTHWGFGVLCCGAVVGVGQSLSTTKAGLWGAVVLALSPVLVYFGSLGYIDAGLAFFQVMALWALLEWMDSPGRQQLLLVGVLTGAAMSCKPHGIATLGVVLVILALTDGRWRTPRLHWQELALAASVALAVASPWYLRSYLFAGNPVWPLAGGIFGGVEFGHVNFGIPGYVRQLVEDPSMTAAVGGFISGILDRLWTKLPSLWYWSWTPQSWQHAIGPHLVALLPGLLLVPRSRQIHRLIGVTALYYVITIAVLQANPRYNMVLLALMAVLAGHVIENLFSERLKSLRPIVPVAIAVTVTLGAAWSFHLARPVWPVATGQVSREDFLRGQESTYPLFEFVNRNLPDDANILFQGIVKGFYCDRAYIWDHPYQRVVHYADLPDDVALARHLASLGVTHVARMIQVPPSRVRLGYPQYFLDPYHERFRKRYLTPIYQDNGYILFRFDPRGVTGNG